MADKVLESDLMLKKNKKKQEGGEGSPLEVIAALFDNVKQRDRSVVITTCEIGVNKQSQ